MFIKSKKILQRAQITTEYAIMVSVVVSAIVAMTFYVKRGFQARYADAMNYTTISPLFNTTQFEPPYSFSDSESERDSVMRARIEEGAQVRYRGSATVVERGYMNVTTVRNN